MSGLQVLVVSADARRAHELGQALRADGHQVMTQRNPASAGPELVAPGLDAVVIDLSMPGVDRTALAATLAPERPNAPPEPLEAVEARHILSTLLYTGGNKRRAALLLGIARSTLIQKVRRHAIQLPGRDGE